MSRDLICKSFGCKISYMQCIETPVEYPPGTIFECPSCKDTLSKINESDNENRN